MELSSQEGEIPIPINSSTYGGGGHGHGHMIHHDPAPHNHIIPSSNGPPIPTSLQLEEPIMPYNKKQQQVIVIRYKECLKNHAAAMGGNATDGCGEFMPSGEEGTLEALTCSACHCHRNFHRKEIEGDPSSSSCDCTYLNRVNGRKIILGHHHHHKNLLAAPTAEAFAGYPASRAVPHQMIMSYNMAMAASESDEQEDVGHGVGVVVARPPPQQLIKKRFRTKFTQEQKDKMLSFAEKVGWKIQKQEESVVQQFCQEIGVKRRVLKVWMHNNKHNLAKKNSPTTTEFKTTNI
ncbi:hypothetical protein L1049_015475 [Liquidambar formosana]|uniref:ZF-HD dimerization-type domain-containing protein n=1 Tax=Liquidambar formosana TaxID=63359 RepID=A0AAP0X2K0_LIQFO